MTKFRQWLARQLVRLAVRIYPDSSEVRQFWFQRMMDIAIIGKHVTRVDPAEIMKDDH